MTLTEEECRSQVDEIIRSDTREYREGLYLSDNEKKLQLEQIINTCSDIAWAMIGQVRKSKVKDMYFEERFGPGSRRLPPVEIELEHGRKAILSGIIDRLDVIDVPEDGVEAVRVIDYKTGSAEIDMEQIRQGYKLQLMVYMNVAAYVVTIIVLVITSMRRKREHQPPEALGLPYFREDR